jgi:hypothetical protein
VEQGNCPAVSGCVGARHLSLNQRVVGSIPTAPTSLSQGFRNPVFPQIPICRASSLRVRPARPYTAASISAMCS